MKLTKSMYQVGRSSQFIKLTKGNETEGQLESYITIFKIKRRLNGIRVERVRMVDYAMHEILRIKFKKNKINPYGQTGCKSSVGIKVWK